jgi:RNA polymerase sigma-70 factor (ECF subfamily)
MNLLERFAKGDLDAFETLFRQFQGRVYAWIVRIVRDTGAAEDLTLETFWRIYRAHDRFDVQVDFGAWAYRIAINLALTHVRRRRPEEELPAEIQQAPGPNPALRREEQEHIRRAFDQLPTKLRIVVTMALIEEKPYSEIAQVLGIAPGTVKSRVFRGVRILRKRLNQMGVTR